MTTEGASGENDKTPRFTITTGEGLDHPQGKIIALGEGDVGLGLSSKIDELRGHEAWFSFHRWERSYALTEHWEASCGFGLDLDYYSKVGQPKRHSAPPAAAAAALARTVANAVVLTHASAYHSTPRGARLLLATEEITDAAQYKAAAEGAAALVERLLLESHLLGALWLDGDGRVVKDAQGEPVVVRDGFVLDRAALFDRARRFFAPRAIVRGVQRDGDVQVRGDGSPWSAAELLVHCAPSGSSAPSVEEGQDEPIDPMARLRATLRATPKARERKDGIAIRCPFHDDSEPSAIVFFPAGNLHCSAAACDRTWRLHEWIGSPEGRQLVGDDVVEAVVAAGSQSRAQNRKVAAVAADVASRELALAHSADRTGWARLPDDMGGYAIPLHSRAMRLYLGHTYYKETGQPLSQKQLGEALDVLEARAVYDGPQVVIHIRVAPVDDATYIDLGVPNDPRVVRVTETGWQIVEMPSEVWMARPAGLLSLPTPERGGTLADLRLLHRALTDEGRWALVASWAVSVWRTRGSYAILALRGENGAGKTGLARILLELLDPREADLRRPPTDARDLIAAASAARILALDNVSELREWLADDLCRLSTGQALTTRVLYTTADEYVRRVRSPVLLTSIPDVVSARGDLRDRTCLVSLPPMPDGERLDDAEIDRRVAAARPRLIGALLDAMVTGLARLGSVSLPKQIRMVDHLRWAVACAPALGLTERQVIDAHLADRSAGASATIDDSTVGRLICQVAADTGWFGSAAELLAEITRVATEAQRRERDWPGSPRAMRAALDRLAPSLRRLDWEVLLPGGGQHRARTITLVPPQARPDRPNRPNSRDVGGLGDVGDPGDVAAAPSILPASDGASSQPRKSLARDQFQALEPCACLPEVPIIESKAGFICHGCFALFTPIDQGGRP